MGIDPGFHRGDDKDWIPPECRKQGATSRRQIQNTSTWEPTVFSDMFAQRRIPGGCPPEGSHGGLPHNESVEIYFGRRYPVFNCTFSSGGAVQTRSAR
jgi:hypothetical protein